jgi:hypothetical protein
MRHLKATNIVAAIGVVLIGWFVAANAICKNCFRLGNFLDFWFSARIAVRRDR